MILKEDSTEQKLRYVWSKGKKCRWTTSSLP